MEAEEEWKLSTRESFKAAYTEQKTSITNCGIDAWKWPEAEHIFIVQKGSNYPLVASTIYALNSLLFNF